MQSTSLKTIATSIAREHDVPLAIVLGIIQVESGGNEFVTRIEPHYRWCWDVRANQPFTATRSQAKRLDAPPGFRAPLHGKMGYYESDNTEWINQKTSWGVMQPMGAVAREYGFEGPLALLTEPMHCIEIGCRHLARLHKRFGHKPEGWAGVVDAYNDGTHRIERPIDYPHKVARTSPEAHEAMGGFA